MINPSHGLIISHTFFVIDVFHFVIIMKAGLSPLIYRLRGYDTLTNFVTIYAFFSNIITNRWQVRYVPRGWGRALNLPLCKHAWPKVFNIHPKRELSFCGKTTLLAPFCPIFPYVTGCYFSVCMITLIPI